MEPTNSHQKKLDVFSIAIGTTLIHYQRDGFEQYIIELVKEALPINIKMQLIGFIGWNFIH